MGRWLCQQRAQTMYCKSMSVFPLRLPFRARPPSRCACLLPDLFRLAQSQAQADKTTPAASKASHCATSLPTTNPHFPRFRPMRTRSRRSMLDGKTLQYTVTVGALPVRDKDGKVAGEVVVTAYTVDGDNRPVTFALNGGPGASSVSI